MVEEGKELSLREIQMVEYQLLCKLVELLEKHNLRYFLTGGTLLGAIRHNGFIPWDDDIDVLVPRDDYEKLRELVKRHETGGLDLKIPEDNGYFFPFIKAIDKRYVVRDYDFHEHLEQYIWVDIFPLDHFPDDTKEHRKWVKKLENARVVLQFAKCNHKAATTRRRKIAFVGTKTVAFMYGGIHNLSMYIDKLAIKMNRKFITSNHAGNGTWPSNTRDYFEMDELFPTTEHIFEDRMFRIPGKYDSFLTKFYGDYMTLPPEDKRIDHHLKAYRREV